MGENIETDERKNGKYKTAERKYDKNIKTAEPRQNTIESLAQQRQLDKLTQRMAFKANRAMNDLIFKLNFKKMLVLRSNR